MLKFYRSYRFATSDILQTLYDILFTQIMIKEFNSQHSESVIQHVKSILTDEFGSEVNEKVDPDLFAIEEHYIEPGGNFWVALDGEKVVGTLALENVGQGRGVLKRMYVSKEHRGSGVAQELLRGLIDFAEKNSFRSLYLGTSENRIAANKFYKKSGFQKIPKLPEDIPNKFDTVFYKYRLDKAE